MDKITTEVRAFYEAYPYPPEGQVDCDGYHGPLLLSYLQRTCSKLTRLQLLEAGCGRGLNLQTMAGKQTEVDFTGIDINRIAIQEATQRSKELGLENLQFLLADLLDKHTLPGVSGGYDIILSYGVLHHLSDPLQGLQHLTTLLASDGVIALMLDGSFGRQPLERYLQALDLVQLRSKSGKDRSPVARALAHAAEEQLFKGNYWQGTSRVDEIEFADRCLHVHQTSYDLTALWQLLNSAGLCFIRWLEPNDWSLQSIIDDQDLLCQLEMLDEISRYQLIERLTYRPKLTLLAARQGSMPRSPLLVNQVASSQFAINPQLHLNRHEVNGLTCTLRRRHIDLNHNACCQNILQKAEQLLRGFTGQNMVDMLAEQDYEPQQVLQGIQDLVESELLYRPHPEQDMV
ncbi:MAG: class I SAM-dependent methyltransferase [Candidatus Thiodiazotropha sp. (ex Troendleina suluensis)]|nr:class I SAM-dependent methyltransferase [Candidatus Thiodiazotropha sp. (ex Troendleina suluensis)]